MIEIKDKHQQLFDRDGFVVVKDAISHDKIEAVRARFPLLFRGEFETRNEPDEWNWREGRDSEELTRQICNCWRADRVIASIVLAEDVGQACATLRGWSGARINQDNVIWKPPGAKPLGFHQDESYQQWNRPGEMTTCWITLDDTRASQGTIEYVRGSHLWPLSPQIEQFHAPDDPLEDMNRAADHAGVVAEIIPIEVPAGSAVIHHGKTWHGSRDNHGTNPRRSVVAHCMAANSEFDPVESSSIYGKYKKPDSLEMDEKDFPVLWSQGGERSGWIDQWLSNKDKQIPDQLPLAAFMKFS